MPIILKSGSLNLLEPSGPVQACNGFAFPLPLPLVKSVDLQSCWCCATYSVIYFDVMMSVSKMKKIKLEDEGRVFRRMERQVF